MIAEKEKKVKPLYCKYNRFMVKLTPSMERLDNRELRRVLARVNIGLGIILASIIFLSLLLVVFNPKPIISVSIYIALFAIFSILIRSFIKLLYNFYDIYREQERIIKRYEEFGEYIEKMARDGFKEIIFEEKDEVTGKISYAFNTLLENTNKLIRELDSLSERVLSSSRQLNETIKQTSESMEEVNTALQNLTKETDSLNLNIEEITRNTKDVEALTNEGISKMSIMEEQMRQIVEATNQTAVMINELNGVSNEIEKIIGVISGIAEQTSLLALNAAIEAARAGEYGRGFAVVADEVRQLSYQTQDFLKEIKVMINRLSEKMTEAVTAITSGNTQVAEGERVLLEVTNNFKIIADRIQDVSKRIEMTAKSSREITEGSKDISSASERQMDINLKLTDMSSNLADIATKLKDRLAETQIGAYNLEIDIGEFDREFNNIDETKRRALKNELRLNNEFVIGVIARLEPIKGHRFLFEGLKLLSPKYKNFRCLIVGDGSLENELKQLVIKEGLGDKVHFLGYRSDIPRLLSIVDLVALTSEKEGVPPKIICEALAARKPVVATNTIGARYLVKDGINGRLVNYGDTKALAEAIESFINNPKRCKEYGQAGRRILEELLKRDLMR